MLERDRAALHLKRPNENDAEQLSRVQFEAVRGTAAAFYPSEVVQSWAPEPSEQRTAEFRRAILSDDELFVVAEREGRVLAFGSIVVSASELRSVYVHPSVGRHGVGSQIVAELEGLAMAHSLASLELTASLNAEKFYVRQGYEVVGRDVRRIGTGVRMACLKMKKALAPPVPAAGRFVAVYPIGDTDPQGLPVRDIGPAVAYYTHVLGFTLVEKTPARAVLARDGVRIGLAVNGRDPEQASCYFEVTDVAALHRELSDKGIEPSALREERHDSRPQRIFFAKEPFGVCFCFGQTQG